MIRVGFVFSSDGNLGVGNYFRNLLGAILSLPARRIEPVIITGRSGNPAIAETFPMLEVLRTSLLERRSIAWGARKLTQRLFAIDPLLDQFLRKHDVAALSHSDYLGLNARTPSICWIGDFQHKHLPQFFTKNEARARDKNFKNICRFSSRVLVSSFDARQDLENFHPDCLERSKVLQFVADLQETSTFLPKEELQRRYQFSGEYFHLPNQFWAHKNHRVIIDALRMSILEGHHIQVLATGSTSDYRQPDYFKELLRYIDDSDIPPDCFKILGVVPYTDLVSLMRHSVAVINPSMFEGWSSTVEEAKSLGKNVILSNIGVHIEQSPERGVFFDPRDAVSLVNILWETWSKYDSATDESHVARALSKLSVRKQEFGKRYQDIVLDALGVEQ